MEYLNLLSEKDKELFHLSVDIQNKIAKMIKSEAEHLPKSEYNRLVLTTVSSLYISIIEVFIKGGYLDIAKLNYEHLREVMSSLLKQ